MGGSGVGVSFVNEGEDRVISVESDNTGFRFFV
jgi:hypothetical protein